MTSLSIGRALPLLAVAILSHTWACFEDHTAGSEDAAAAVSDGGSALGDADAAAVGDGGSACGNVDASDGMCVVCGGLWYCPGNPPAPPCPNEGTGACEADSRGCFTCQGGASVSYCGCGSEDGGVDDGGGDTDGGVTWSCEPAEFGCPE